MSADKWSECPMCKRNNPVESTYGKVPEKEYLESISKKVEEDTETLRQDWEIYLDEDGILTATFSCRCSKCGWVGSFTAEKDLLNGRRSDDPR